MKTSIIIPVRGRSELFTKCIQQIQATVSGDYEIIVVDDHSVPPLSVDDPSIRVVANEKSLGPGGSRNVGAQQASGDVLVFIDSDIVIEKNAIDAMTEKLRNSEYEAVQGMFASKSPFQNFSSNYKNLYWNYNQSQMNPESFSICTAIFTIKKKAFEQVGGFNEDSLIGEDREIGYKLQKNAAKVYQLKEAQGTHYKRFSFRQLVLHHFQNAVNHATFLLFIRREPIEDRTAGGGKKQVLGIIFSPVFMLATLIAMIIPNVYTLFVACLLWIFYIYITSGFVNYCSKQRGFIFAFLACFTYILEEFIAFLGLGWGTLRYAVFQNKKLNFRFGSG